MTLMLSRRCVIAVLWIGCLGNAWAQTPDPLPSWNDGAVKKSITDFVARVTTPGGPDFVPVEQRIATFDNDGTLWCEQPVYFQVAFAFDRVKALAPQHPEWRSKQPFKALLDKDPKALAAAGEKGLLEIIEATHTGMTVGDFTKIVLDWTATARHPRFKRLYIDLVYQPMIELLGHLRANGFKTYIVSGGGIEFMRPWTEKVYGIPPEQVVGSSGVVKFEMGADGKPVLTKLPKIEFVDDGPGKPVGINASSAVIPSSLSAIRTVTSRCWNGPQPAVAHASWASCIIPMPCANMPTTGIPKSANSTRRLTKASRSTGRSST
jgi:phosphoglycolate phosphatase-like HAD superfamily hydrolase